MITVKIGIGETIATLNGMDWSCENLIAEQALNQEIRSSDFFNEYIPGGILARENFAAYRMADLIGVEVLELNSKEAMDAEEEPVFEGERVVY